MLKSLSCLAMAILSIFAFGLGGLYCSIEWEAHIDEARSAEAIVVLGAAVRPGGRPSPVLRARMEHAVTLYKRGLAPLLILSGGIGCDPSMTEAEAMASLAEEMGIPREALVLEKEAHSTSESVEFTGHIMRERGIHSVIVVSSPFHMRRALLMYRDAGFTAYGSPAPNDPLQACLASRVRYTLRECVLLARYLLLGT